MGSILFFLSILCCHTWAHTFNPSQPGYIVSSEPARTIQGDPVYKQQTSKTSIFCLQVSLLLLSTWPRNPGNYKLVTVAGEIVQWV